jgi:Pyruvate/2-oxoacid:ferredoxin oxidoreductase delta subunit
MDRPCIVCQENCPVSPKAITTRIADQPVMQDMLLTVAAVERRRVQLQQNLLPPDKVATGDYFCAPDNQPGATPARIQENTSDVLVLAEQPDWQPLPAEGTRIQLFIRLQRPYVAPERCIGCGVCEHECPVAGKRAIRVSAENETRNRKHRMLIGG